jgi:hypothetical protein
MATTNIQVVCRFRPQNSLEKSTDGRECVTIADDKMTVNMNVRLNSVFHKAEQSKQAQFHV